MSSVSASRTGAIHDVLSGILEQDLHAKRVNSLCDPTFCVLHSGSLAVCTIGLDLPPPDGLKPKHAINQVDSSLSNTVIAGQRQFETSWFPSRG